MRKKLFLCEVVQRLQQDLGVTVSESTACRALTKLRLSRKKLTRIVTQKFNASNMARYALFTQAQAAMNTRNTVFLDETHLCDLAADRTHGRRGAQRCLRAPQPAAHARARALQGRKGHAGDRDRLGARQPRPLP